MKKMKKIIFASLGVLCLGLAASLTIANHQTSFRGVKAAEAQTGLSLVLLGTGVKVKTNDGQNGWAINSKVPLSEVSTGIYTACFYTTGGDFTIIESDKGWGGLRYGYNQMVSNDYGYLTSSDSGQNVNVGDFWGYLRVTVDTTENEKQLTVKQIWAGSAPTLSGDGISGGSWSTTLVDFIFDTDDGVIFTKEVTTVKDNRWAIIKYDSWDKYGEWDNVNHSSPAAGDFSNTYSTDITSNKNGDYVLKYDMSASSSEKISMFAANDSHYVTYMEGSNVLGKDVAEAGEVYNTIRYKTQCGDANKRIVAWCTDAALTAEYAPAALNSNLDLHAKVEDYSRTVYFAPGRDYTWGGVKIYAWEADGYQTLGAWPGVLATHVGGGIYSYTFVGEQEPVGFTFSDSGNDGNKTDVDYPDGKNLYIYQADSYQTIDANMIAAEQFGKKFLEDTAAGCSAKDITSGIWSTVMANAAEFYEDDDVLAVILANNGVYKVAGLENDYLDEALRRYSDILSKYPVTDFLNISAGNAGGIYSINNTNNSNSSMMIIISVITVLGIASAAFFIIRRKKSENN